MNQIFFGGEIFEQFRGSSGMTSIPTGLGFRVWGLEFRISGLGFRVKFLGLRVEDLGLGVEG